MVGAPSIVTAYGPVTKITTDQAGPNYPSADTKPPKVIQAEHRALNGNTLFRHRYFPPINFHAGGKGAETSVNGKAPKRAP